VCDDEYQKENNETGKFCDNNNDRECHYYADDAGKLQTIGPTNEIKAGSFPFCWVEPSCPDFDVNIQGIPYKYCDETGDTYAKVPESVTSLPNRKSLEAMFDPRATRFN
jgi:hypothetical protein